MVTITAKAVGETIGILLGLVLVIIVILIGLLSFVLILWQVIITGREFGLNELSLMGLRGICSFLAVLVAHELGKIIAGHVVGLTVDKLTLLFLTIERQEGRMRLRLNLEWFHPAAVVWMSSSELTHWRAAVVVLGGPLADMLVGVVCLAMASTTNIGPPLPNPRAMNSPWKDVALVWPRNAETAFFNVIGLLSVFWGIRTLIPHGSGAYRSDGGKLLDVLRQGFGWGSPMRGDKATSDLLLIDPNSAMSHDLRGLEWTQRGEYDKAIQDFDEAIRLNPRCAWFYQNRGQVFLAKKEYAKAMKDYEQAIQLDLKFADAYNSQAWLWATCPDATCRDGRKAVWSARQACDLMRWKDPRLIETLAAAYAEAGYFEEAIKYQNMALESLHYEEEQGENAHQRLQLYLGGQPYREKSPPQPDEEA